MMTSYEMNGSAMASDEANRLKYYQTSGELKDMPQNGDLQHYEKAGNTNTNGEEKKEM